MRRVDVLRFGVRLARESAEPPEYVAQSADRLCRIGAALDGLACAYSNGDLTDGQQARQARQARLVGDADKLAASLGAGFAAIHSGDPRGCVLKVKLPSGYSDSWAGVGLCVPYWR